MLKFRFEKKFFFKFHIFTFGLQNLVFPSVTSIYRQVSRHDDLYSWKEEILSFNMVYARINPDQPQNL